MTGAYVQLSAQREVGRVEKQVPCQWIGTVTTRQSHYNVRSYEEGVEFE
jgi:hypothetical protein